MLWLAPVNVSCFFCRSSIASSLVSLGPMPSVDIDFTSPPAQKAFPEPVINRDLTSSLLSNSFIMFLSAGVNSSDKAFLASGLFKIITPIF